MELNAIIIMFKWFCISLLGIISIATIQSRIKWYIPHKHMYTRTKKKNHEFVFVLFHSETCNLAQWIYNAMLFAKKDSTRWQVKINFTAKTKHKTKQKFSMEIELFTKPCTFRRINDFFENFHNSRSTNSFEFE